MKKSEDEEVVVVTRVMLEREDAGNADYRNRKPNRIKRRRKKVGKKMKKRKRQKKP